jgi:chromosome segregation ATPase
MPTKDSLQTQLKQRYGINKNITQTLSVEDCEALLRTLADQPETVRLVMALVDKNTQLGRNNATFGRQRSLAEQRLEALQTDYQALEQEIATLERAKPELEARKQILEAANAQLEAEIASLIQKTGSMERQVQRLSGENRDLTSANQVLKEDNKRLKNLIDAIRLKLAQDVRSLLKYEDSEIRKALLKWFKSSAG